MFGSLTCDSRDGRLTPQEFDVTAVFREVRGFEESKLILSRLVPGRPPQQVSRPSLGSLSQEYAGGQVAGPSFSTAMTNRPWSPYHGLPISSNVAASQTGRPSYISSFSGAPTLSALQNPNFRHRPFQTSPLGRVMTTNSALSREQSSGSPFLSTDSPEPSPFLGSTTRPRLSGTDYSDREAIPDDLNPKEPGDISQNHGRPRSVFERQGGNLGLPPRRHLPFPSENKIQRLSSRSGVGDGSEWIPSGISSDMSQESSSADFGCMASTAEAQSHKADEPAAINRTSAQRPKRQTKDMATTEQDARATRKTRGSGKLMTEFPEKDSTPIEVAPRRKETVCRKEAPNEKTSPPKERAPRNTASLQRATKKISGKTNVKRDIPIKESRGMNEPRKKLPQRATKKTPGKMNTKRETQVKGRSNMNDAKKTAPQRATKDCPAPAESQAPGSHPPCGKCKESGLICIMKANGRACTSCSKQSCFFPASSPCTCCVEKGIQCLVLLDPRNRKSCQQCTRWQDCSLACVQAPKPGRQRKGAGKSTPMVENTDSSRQETDQHGSNVMPSQKKRQTNQSFPGPATAPTSTRTEHLDAADLAHDGDSNDEPPSRCTRGATRKLRSDKTSRLLPESSLAEPRITKRKERPGDESQLRREYQPKMCRHGP